MTGAEKILLAFARQGPYGTRDIEFDAPLIRAAERLARLGVLKITSPCDGQTFSAALA